MLTPRYRGLWFALLLAGLGSCSTPTAAVTAGRNGYMEAIVTITGAPLELVVDLNEAVVA